MIIVRLLSPEPVGWLTHHQLYSGLGADIVMESITPATGWVTPTNQFESTGQGLASRKTSTVPNFSSNFLAMRLAGVVIRRLHSERRSRLEVGEMAIFRQLRA